MTRSYNTHVAAWSVAGSPQTMARPVYVIYPAALFDGWEVVEEGGASPAIFDTQDEAVHYAELRATLGGGAVVKLENWFGDTERVWEVPAHAVRDSHRP